MLGISEFSRSYLRRRAEGLLEDACIITRPVQGEVKTVYDPVTKRAIRNQG